MSWHPPPASANRSFMVANGLASAKDVHPSPAPSVISSGGLYLYKLPAGIASGINMANAARRSINAKDAPARCDAAITSL